MRLATSPQPFRASGDAALVADASRADAATRRGQHETTRRLLRLLGGHSTTVPSYAATTLLTPAPDSPRDSDPTLPQPRGPITAQLLKVLKDPPHDVDGLRWFVRDALARVHSAMDETTARRVLGDGDVQLGLELLYALHYRSLPEVDDGWEWHPGLIAARAELEATHERALLTLTAGAVDRAADGGRGRLTPSDRLKALIDEDAGPSVATYVMGKATADQVRDLVAQKSQYHLREADFQTWMIPRLFGRAKAALIEIQVDEYGSGRPGQLHQQLYADLMRRLDLVPREGAYRDAALPEALALTNTLSLFGLHRRHRGRCVGHLAAVEMTSSLPCRRLSNGLDRLGFDSDVRRFYEEHVLADAVHEQVASVDLVGSLVADEPKLLRPVLEGAAASLLTEAMLGEALLSRWAHGRFATPHVAAATQPEADPARAVRRWPDVA